MGGHPESKMFEDKNKLFLSKELEKVRTKLLDMTVRNRLLNFRGHSLSINIVDELPNEVYEKLVIENKELAFKPIPELFEETDDDNQNLLTRQQLLSQSAEKANIDLNLILPQDSNSKKKKHTDCSLQTNMFMKELEAKLRRVQSNARTLIEETGQNQLFLVIGFLQWVDSQDKSKHYEAPLILLPVEIFKGRLDKPTNKYVYEIKFTEEDIIPNVSLAEKLKRDFNVILPDYDDDSLRTDAEDYNTLQPEKYFEVVQNVIKDMKGWTVLRKMVLGFFSFSKLLMYKDLDPNNPSNKSLFDHSIINQIILGQKAESAPMPVDYNNGELENLILNFPLVVDADSSQATAIIKGLTPKNMVIQGPPGTGKSQTITNLISCMIDQGKTVLFVAEKMAALEVVKRNLQKVGLGEFCLELHSHKSNKSEVLKQLQSRYEKRFSKPSDLNFQKQKLLDSRDKLANYINLLHKELKPIQETIFKIFWKADNLRSDFRDSNYFIKNCEKITSKEIENNIINLKQLEEHANFIYTSDNVWDGFDSTEFYYGDEVVISNHLNETNRSIENIFTTLEKMKNELNVSFSLERISLLSIDILQEFVNKEIPNDLNYYLFIKLLISDENSAKIVQNFIDSVNVYNKTMSSVQAYVHINQITNYDNQYNNEIFKSISHLSLKDAKSVLQMIKEVYSISDGLKPALDAIQQNRLAVIVSIKDFKQIVELCLGFQELHINPDDPQYKSIFSAESIKILNNAFTENEELENRRTLLSQLFAVNDSPSCDEIEKIRKALRANVNNVFRLFNKEYRYAKKLIKTFLIKHNYLKQLKTDDSLLKHLEDLQLYKMDLQKFQENSDFRKILNTIFKENKVEWNLLKKYLIWYERVAKVSKSENDIIKIAAKIHEKLPPLDNTFNLLKNYDEKIENTKKNAAKYNINIDKMIIAENINQVYENINILYSKLKDIVSVSDILSKDASTKLNIIGNALTEYNKVKELPEKLNNKKDIGLLIGESYYGVNTNLLPVQNTLYYHNYLTQKNIKQILPQKESLDSYKEMVKQIGNYIHSIREQYEKINSIETNLEQYGKIQTPIFWGNDFSKIPFANIKIKLEKLINNINILSKWSDYKRLLHRLNEYQLYPFVELVLNKKVELKRISEAYQCAFYNSLSRIILKNEQMLNSFSSHNHEQVRQTFKDVDKQLQNIIRKNIAFNASKKKPPEGDMGRKVSDYTEMFLLEKEFSKSRRHIPIRQLINRAGEAIKALKPIFMMSPLSVAQFLEPGKHSFDVVIMDEASQILPQDALGAIVRGRQLIVVGDSKQLPPTTFFMSEYGEENEEEKSLADDTDSILELCQSIGFEKKRLKWHYRSIHESLIAFSNSHWYDNELVLFPSYDSSNNDIGIKFHYVKEAKYSNGKNEKEALIIANKIIEHYRRTPHLTLGVGTLNRKQREVIEDYLDMIRKKDNSIDMLLEKAMDRNQNEPLFIKNLENLQGDERDVIYISCTYGPDSETGKIYQRFGPINSQGGTRRLNVLFSRAKRRMEIFSSMHPDDITGGSEASAGAVALKSFMVYAQTGRLPDFGIASNRQPDSDFEISVAKSLSLHGYNVVAQVGVSGYFIDLAVKNPRIQGEYVLGIECDGASYHSSICARDRDRLREEILKLRGWNIYRIWSTDWYKNKDQELSKLLSCLKAVISEKTVIQKIEENQEPADVFELKSKEIIEKEISSNRLSENELRDRIKKFLSDSLINSTEEGISIRDDKILEHIIRKRINSMTEFRESVPIDIRNNLISEEIPLLHDIFQIIESGS